MGRCSAGLLTDELVDYVKVEGTFKLLGFADCFSPVASASGTDILLKVREMLIEVKSADEFDFFFLIAKLA